jgi:hypothetical protein
MSKYRSSKAGSIRGGVNWVVNAIRGHLPEDRFAGGYGIKVAATILACELPANYIRYQREIIAHLIETGAMTFQVEGATGVGYWVLGNRSLPGFVMACCPSVHSAESPGRCVQEEGIQTRSTFRAFKHDELVASGTTVTPRAKRRRGFRIK